MKKCLYLSVFFIAFFSSCSDNELEEMSNSVPVSKYPQKVIDISMESPESFSHFSNTWGKDTDYNSIPVRVNILML